jgi:hypothetical protein
MSSIPRENEKSVSSLEEIFPSMRSGGVLRPLPSQIFIPSHFPNVRKDRTEGLLVKFHLRGLKISRHLLWHSIFKGINVIQWFLLFEFLELNLKRGSRFFNACLFGVLSTSSSSRMEMKNWNFQTKPIHREFRNHILKTEFLENKERGISLLDFILIILNVPNKGLSIDKILTVFETSIQYPVPKPTPWRGVGYKDKGSMGGYGPEPAPLNDKEILLLNEFDTSSLLSDWKLITDHFSKI